MVVSIFQLKTCLMGLRFEKKSGMRVSHAISAREFAKKVLGYSSKQRPSFDELIAKMETLLSEAEQVVEENRLARNN